MRIKLTFFVSVITIFLMAGCGFKVVNQSLFSGHSYSMPTIGTAESILDIQSQTLKKLHLSNLSEKEILLTYCGDLDLDDVIQTIKENIDSDFINRKKTVKK